MSICGSCGLESPDWADFCIHCSEGLTSFVMQICPKCGAGAFEGSSFCHSCGHDFERAEGERRPASTLALILAIVPALFGIYGLAHIYTRHMLTGLILLGSGISLLLIGGLLFRELGLAGLVILALDIAIFLWQVWDIIRINNKECGAEQSR